MGSLGYQRSEENETKYISITDMSYTTLQILELIVENINTLNVPDKFVSYVKINNLIHEVDNGQYKEPIKYQDLIDDFYKHTIFKVIENDKFYGEVFNLIANTKVIDNDDYIRFTLNNDIAPYYKALKKTYKQINDDSK